MITIENQKGKDIGDIAATMRDTDDDLGSYTGTPGGEFGPPIQDADDL